MVCISMGLHAFLASKVRRFGWMGVFAAFAILFLPFVYPDIVTMKQMGMVAGVDLSKMMWIHTVSVIVLLIFIFAFRMPRENAGGK